MAHAYTTKRGKNKKGKLGVRKDQQQNSERSIKKIIVDTSYEGPKESIFTIGRLGNNSINKSKDEVNARQLAIAAVTASTNPLPSSSTSSSASSDIPIVCALCTKKGITFPKCSKCLSVFYCSSKCQLDHWKDHKIRCKELCKEAEERVNVNNNVEAVANGISSMKIKGAGDYDSDNDNDSDSDSSDDLN